MITKLTKLSEVELDQLIDIWFNANVEAHSFIKRAYWQEMAPKVRMMIPEASIYVFKSADQIIGFIGMMDDYIAGLFVKEQWRKQGIGQALLTEAKQSHDRLLLKVFQENQNAVNFYINNGFKLLGQEEDPNTAAIEYTMQWVKEAVNESN
ncbi:GNAT family N-acetyltransferase [Amphibacillus sediminis]|uniref:GNAT family N-acetyltransferase n=1 Tax=Amphibacillus sediminis TaxID=360185 RepID=UPI0008329638|nr:GNAT family N-acetyltransferase [Amphibacillus sediminis]